MSITTSSAVKKRCRCFLDETGPVLYIIVSFNIFIYILYLLSTIGSTGTLVQYICMMSSIYVFTFFPKQSVFKSLTSYLRSKKLLKKRPRNDTKLSVLTLYGHLYIIRSLCWQRPGTKSLLGQVVVH